MGVARPVKQTLEISGDDMDEDRIVCDPNICSGNPTIRGTRIMVTNILGMVAGDYQADRIIKA